jgi:hypothetical protein
VATEIGTTIATIVPDEIPLLPAQFQNVVVLDNCKYMISIYVGNA